MKTTAVYFLTKSGQRTLFNNLVVVIYDGEVEPVSGEALLGIPAFISRCIRYIPKGSVFLGLYDQATKRAWWMPRW